MSVQDLLASASEENPRQIVVISVLRTGDLRFRASDMTPHELCYLEMAFRRYADSKLGFKLIPHTQENGHGG